MALTKRLAIMAAGGFLLAGLAPAYHHFTHYLTRTGPYVPIVEKFDLNALVNKTVHYYISEQGPTQYAPNDNFTAVVSQIRLAAQVWNDVATSDLRLAYGGLFTPGTPQTSPGIEVIFDEVPPGVVAVGGPTSRAEMRASPNGPFVPITRSVVILRRDLAQRPSYGEAFFLTMVHELGHTLGLQHTLTSSVMSTEITRASTKAKPLGADDVAAISLLYPVAGFAAGTGTISGRVTLGGAGVSLASVVALAPQGAAVSALTNPDGTYRIEGVPPGQYYVYAHPLPPALAGEVTPANLVLPLDVDNRPVAPGPGFETQFYPGTKDPHQAMAIAVGAGAGMEGVNFFVRPRSVSAVYAVQTYSFPGPIAVKPAYLNLGAARPFLVAYGVGLTSGGQPAPGLDVTGIGGSARVLPGGLRAYAPAPAYLQIDLQFSLLSGEGPLHLVFSLDNDIYVLPSAVVLTQKQPPLVSLAAATFDTTGNRVVAVTGTNLSAQTRILFDGAAASNRGVDEMGRLLVTPPPAPGGHRSTVVALNADGQSSLFMQGATPPSYEYDPGETGTFVVSPAALAAGVDAMVEITGASTSFVSGQTTVGFGSSDVVVRRLWVLGPSRIQANVVVSANAPQAWTQVTVATGLRTLARPYGFQVLPHNPRQLVLIAPVVDAVTGQASVQAGGTATVRVSQFYPEQGTSGLLLTVNDRPVTILSAQAGQITFQVPSDLSPGPAVLRLQVGLESAAPIAMSVEIAPPLIRSVFVLPNTQVDASRPARPGELLNVLTAGLGEAGVSVQASRIRVTVGGIEHQALTANPSVTQPGLHQVQFFLGTAVRSGSAVPITVSIDGRTSLPYPIPVQ